jgi:hypothetical protein
MPIARKRLNACETPMHGLPEPLRRALARRLLCLECGWGGEAMDCLYGRAALFCPRCAAEVWQLMKENELFDLVEKMALRRHPGL